MWLPCCCCFLNPCSEDLRHSRVMDSLHWSYLSCPTVGPGTQQGGLNGSFPSGEPCPGRKGLGQDRPSPGGVPG